MQSYPNISVIGAGAWGTALASVLAQRQAIVQLWAHDPARAARINATHLNLPYLPDLPLPDTIRATASLAEAATGDALLLVVPSHYLRTVARQLAPHVRAGTPLIVCTKGIEEKSGLLMTAVVAEEIPTCPVAVLTGPSFAAEVMRQQPTAVALAASPGTAPVAALAAALTQPAFSVCPNSDPIGSQIGGAVKNVIAIACGVLDGAGCGDNARAAVMTSGFLEIAQLAQALGGRIETVMGLTGFGDLTLTCNSRASRNYRFGCAVGEGGQPQALLAASPSVIEGAENVHAVLDLAKRCGLHLAVCSDVRELIAGRLSVSAFTTHIAATACHNEKIFA